jgi:hypothetical protein
MDKRMNKKILSIFCVCIGFFSFTGVVMAKGEAFISVGSIDMVYDVRVNGMPVIKNRKIQTRSLLVPVDLYLQEGSNKVEVNFLGAHLEDGDLIRSLSDRAIINLGFRLGGVRYKAIDIENKNDQPYVSLHTKDDGAFYVGDDYLLDSSVFYAGPVKEKSTSVSFEIFVENYDVKKVYWLDGEEVDENDYAELKEAYVEAHDYISSDNGSEYMMKMSEFYKSLSYFYYDESFEKAMEEQEENFKKIGAGGKVLKDLDFSKAKMEIFAEGRLARLIFSPLAWDLKGKNMTLNLVFKKMNGKFFPVFIPNDNSF